MQGLRRPARHGYRLLHRHLAPWRLREELQEAVDRQQLTKVAELTLKLDNIDHVAKFRTDPRNFKVPPPDIERALEAILTEDDDRRRSMLRLQTEAMMVSAVAAWEAT
jgi:hypothetical protein